MEIKYEKKAKPSAKNLNDLLDNYLDANKFDNSYTTTTNDKTTMSVACSNRKDSDPKYSPFTIGACQFFFFVCRLDYIDMVVNVLLDVDQVLRSNVALVFKDLIQQIDGCQCVICIYSFAYLYNRQQRLMNGWTVLSNILLLLDCPTVDLMLDRRILQKVLTVDMLQRNQMGVLLGCSHQCLKMAHHNVSVMSFTSNIRDNINEKDSIGPHHSTDVMDECQLLGCTTVHSHRRNTEYGVLLGKANPFHRN